MVTRGGIRAQLAAALVALGVLGMPAVAHAQGQTLDGAPLNVFADGLGAIQVRQDGIDPGLFYDPEENPAHAGIEIKEGDSYYPLEEGFTTAPGRVSAESIMLTDLGGGTKLMHTAYTIGPHLRVSEDIAYTDGTTAINIHYGIQNVSGAPVSIRAGALADLYVGNNDSGNGVIAAVPPRFVGGRDEASGLVYGLQEVTPWLAYQEGDFGDVFDNFSADGLANTVDSAAPDNGVGVEFALNNIAPGEVRGIDVRWLLAAAAPPGTVSPPPPNPVNAGIEQLPPPVPGKNVNVSVRKGRIFIKIPPSKKFVELTDARQIPLGATIDATKGRVNLLASPDSDQLAWFYDGIFKIGQTKGSSPITDLGLAQTLTCPKKGKSASASAGKKSRKLWGEGKGKFRTTGKFSSATVRGTRWLVEDRCDSTLTRVTQGSVVVRDFRLRKNVVVRAGKKYVARKTK